MHINNLKAEVVEFYCANSYIFFHKQLYFFLSNTLFHL